MNLAVRRLRTAGRQASGLISDKELVDPIHRLRRRWGQRLVIFAADPGTKPKL